MAAYNELAEYWSTRGNLAVPRGLLSETGRDLYLWISEQRRDYKQRRLASERKKLLDEIGFSWGAAG